MNDEAFELLLRSLQCEAKKLGLLLELVMSMAQERLGGEEAFRKVTRECKSHTAADLKLIAWETALVEATGWELYHKDYTKLNDRERQKYNRRAYLGLVDRVDKIKKILKHVRCSPRESESTSGQET